ncbi:Copper resistance D domain protein [Frankia canadensis]|uniref:Copper resistance D domain protein n=1 Tax=Frankia canadensis TaxID=1836972 RepID=A0A2I2KUH4_9ACTN|nr:CopD family protein [Frankia canadensis]SNQ49310.1 Copper resistance D domain protein [Frankia canadensis]SOU56600.1 Copper resistance D domain protein [Frankia canadensis]
MALPRGHEIVAAPAPSTPLGPFQDTAMAWTTWVTLMGLVGLTAFALLVAAPVARRFGGDATATARLARVAAPLGVLAVPAVLSDVAHQASATGGFDYSAAWNALYDGSNAGRLLGLQVTLSLVGALLVAPLALRRVAAGRARGPLLGAGLLSGAVALGTTKFPVAVPDDGGRTIVETVMWMLHLFGGSIWIGGLAGLVLLALPGGVVTGGPSVGGAAAGGEALERPRHRAGNGAGDQAAFWSATIRRFSAVAMSCVAAIALSGLFLYWEHVDGPSQLLSTMYGRVLGVKILLFGALLLLGMVNQFWLHPRIDALRAAGDSRPLRTIIAREFPAVVAVELLLGLTVLFVAPFLHGSARNQAFAADAAQHATSTVAAQSAFLGPKTASTSTWIWGTTETIVIIGAMAGGYRVSGRLAQSRARALARRARDGGDGPPPWPEATTAPRRHPGRARGSDRTGRPTAR